ncbi:hypothetical protein SLS56_005890 [Neofusicoccum ribis]|uniref:Uncharacterized protein n=1 Tax=Neofusicoccum ribis TaxID=45134 RepID=A0ABR3ST21_9PEZI
MATYDQVPTTEMKDSELEVHELSNRPNNAELVPFSNKSSVFLTIILPTVVSLVLVVSTENGWRIRGQAFDWIEENRATTQIFVQIVAGILGVSQISTLRNLINYSARQKLLQRPVTLDTLNFYSSLTTSQTNWSLPILPLAVVLSTATIAIIPAALWAGALTPVLAVSSETPQLHIPVPVWSNETKNLWEKHWYDRPNTNVTQTPLGIFSYGPYIDRYGFFLNDGSAASTLDGSPQKYKKSDNSNYTYHGRSYGVGSSIGLNDSFLTPDLHIANYTFFETGYLTRFKCIYNTSTEWALEISGTPWSQSLPQVYNVSTSSTLLTTEEGRTRSQTAFVAYKPADVLHLAAGSSYALLNATQCTATTTATNFSVAADVSTRLITVSPVAQAAAPDPEPSGLVARWAAETLVPLTWIGSTSFTSVPGDMLYRNVFNVRQQPTGEADADRVLRAVEESLDALFDLAMVAQASA